MIFEVVFGDKVIIEKCESFFMNSVKLTATVQKIRVIAPGYKFRDQVRSDHELILKINEYKI